MKTLKTTTPLLVGLLVAFTGCATPPASHWSGKVGGANTMTSAKGIVLEGFDKVTSPDSFRPPVEITIVAKTDSSDLRIGYAADQVIFNWKMDTDQLRVDGGPGGGQHIDGAGSIPIDEYVTIRWLVTPRHQAIYVNNELRFEHCGNYAETKRPVSVFPAEGSVVTVKSVTVKQQ